MRLRLLIAAMLVASCASPQPSGVSATKSQGNYNRDFYECEREATFAGGDNKQQVFDKCMKARGYTRPEWPHTQ